MAEKKTLGQAIDEIVNALSALDEKSRPTAIAAACAHLGIEKEPEVAVRQTPMVSPRGAAALASIQPAQTPKDIRTLKDEKQPENAREMACLVAYYLQNYAPENERKDVVTADDIVKYFKQAHFPLPKRIPQLLIDARHSGYFDPAERGAYRLNAVGYNLVAHTLPRTRSGK
jgi:hypothetical protein